MIQLETNQILRNKISLKFELNYSVGIAMNGVPPSPTTNGNFPSHCCVFSHSKYCGLVDSASLIILIAAASPFASAMFAAAIPSACAACCLASTSILLRSFSALNAFCSASTLDSMAWANNTEN